MTSIIETRKKLRKSTYCAFIDFKKAYDTINRGILWKRLSDIGIGGKIVNAIKSLYSNVMSCVRVNGFKTDWFDVNCGLRQGCILSPLLFNLFINDLSLYLKSFGVGVSIDDELICIMLYADDIVIMAESAEELQILLTALNNWCEANDMHINSSKSNIVHFRTNACPLSEFNFTCGSIQLKIVDRYTYLGVVLHEHLDYNITVKAVAQSAGRALGLLIAKCKSIGGLPFSVFTKLYDSVVWPVVNYSAPLWGFRSYSCIEAVHNRAQRFFLGVGKYTPNDGISGEMGWKPPIVRQWKCIGLYWSKLACMANFRTNKRIAIWSNRKSSRSCKNWYYNIKNFLEANDLHMYCSIDNPIARSLAHEVEDITFDTFTTNWLSRINNSLGSSGRGRNKLRIYKLFKVTYKTERYCEIMLPVKHRSAYSKFRLGVAPIRIETGRYEGLTEDHRVCPFCEDTVVENELHVVLQCHVYNDIREELVNKACVIIMS